MWKRSSDHPRRSRDDPCNRNDQSSEIDPSSILATETTGTGLSNDRIVLMEARFK